MPVPLDLQSKGLKYKDFQSDKNLFSSYCSSYAFVFFSDQRSSYLISADFKSAGTYLPERTRQNLPAVSVPLDLQSKGIKYKDFQSDKISFPLIIPRVRLRLFRIRDPHI